VCVSQAPYLFDESIHVLKFASIATRVTVEPLKQLPRPAAAAARKTTSRFSSLLAAGGGGGGKSLLMASVLSGRSSIAWEEPRSRSTMLPDFTGGRSRQGWKKPGFLKKNQPSGFFWVFLFFCFLFFCFFFTQKREFLGFFSFKKTFRCTQTFNYKHSY
jgi:hypothetical protein